MRSRYAQIVLLVALALPGCATTPQRSNEVRRLMAFPGFQDAGRAAPGWTVEALDAVAELEHELSQYR